jgi:hypothetical protein
LLLYSKSAWATLVSAPWLVAQTYRNGSDTEGGYRIEHLFVPNNNGPGLVVAPVVRLQLRFLRWKHLQSCGWYVDQTRIEQPLCVAKENHTLPITTSPDLGTSPSSATTLWSVEMNVAREALVAGSRVQNRTPRLEHRHNSRNKSKKQKQNSNSKPTPTPNQSAYKRPRTKDRGSTATSPSIASLVAKGAFSPEILARQHGERAPGLLSKEAVSRKNFNHEADKYGAHQEPSTPSQAISKMPPFHRPFYPRPLFTQSRKRVYSARQPLPPALAQTTTQLQ